MGLGIAVGFVFGNRRGSRVAVAATIVGAMLAGLVIGELTSDHTLGRRAANSSHRRRSAADAASVRLVRRAAGCGPGWRMVGGASTGGVGRCASWRFQPISHRKVMGGATWVFATSRLVRRAAGGCGLELGALALQPIGHRKVMGGATWVFATSWPCYPRSFLLLWLSACSAQPPNVTATPAVPLPTQTLPLDIRHLLPSVSPAATPPAQPVPCRHTDARTDPDAFTASHGWFGLRAQIDGVFHAPSGEATQQVLKPATRAVGQDDEVWTDKHGRALLTFADLLKVHHLSRQSTGLQALDVMPVAVETGPWPGRCAGGSGSPSPGSRWSWSATRRARALS